LRPQFARNFADVAFLSLLNVTKYEQRTDGGYDFFMDEI